MEISGIVKGEEAQGATKSPQTTAGDAQRDAKLRKACRDFEALFLFNLFKEMRQTVPRSGLLPSAPGKETFQMMFDQKVAEDLSGRGEGMGLQKMLYEQLRRR
ncbi:MAG: rod-binding protein [Syntrophales bacterium]